MAVLELDLKRASKVKEVLDFIRKHKIEVIDLKFTDLPGQWQHFSVLSSEILGEDEDGGIFGQGIGFDGSSIRGFQEIHESDMLLIPDPEGYFIDPFLKEPTLSLVCDIYDPVTKGPYSRDPRYVARKAEEHLAGTGIADTIYVGPEAEFFIFDDIRFDQNVNSGYYYIDSVEGSWNSGRSEGPNLGYKPRPKEGYFPVPPHDSLQDIRTEMVLTMKRAGIPVEVHHHEVATAGQCEIDLRFGTLTTMGDRVLAYKYMVKNVANRHGKVATFMPKPLFGDNGSGMHTHQSLWKAGRNLFYDAEGYARLSRLAHWYIGGLLHHARALMAFCAPTTNSYKRLVPGYEAPVNLVYSSRNRSAAIRIPAYSESVGAKRIEFRPPDPTCNPYLSFAAMLMAGLDGIRKKMDPGSPIDENIYELPPERAAKIRTVPSSLEESLKALEDDHEFLLEGNVFTPDLIEMWINYKRQREMDPVRLRPHPYEFYLYFDA
ncbi:MAG: type I glutamate--ammonia ligase [Firmicutes bacterium]|nr:type I glutamate--ammonia ligase [Bacillota bacterium]